MRLDERPLESIFGIRLGSPPTYLVAPLAAGAAVFLRLSLDVWFNNAQFIFYYPIVLLVALLFGGGPGVLTALLCGFGSWYLVIPPRGSWEIVAFPQTVALCLYFLLSSIGAVAVGALRRTITQLRAAEQRQRVLVEELQHRTRNLLGIVRGMSHQLLRSSASLAEFSERFDHRLAALSRVQSLLSRGSETVDFDELLRMELLAHDADPGGERIRLAGPRLSLSAQTAQSAALAIHELTTNARKHGALSQDRGRLSVSWELANAHEPSVAVVDWQESGLHLSGSVAPAKGFGLRLIEEALPYDLGTRTSFAFRPEGIHCRIELPLEAR